MPAVVNAPRGDAIVLPVKSGSDWRRSFRASRVSGKWWLIQQRTGLSGCPIGVVQLVAAGLAASMPTAGKGPVDVRRRLKLAGHRADDFSGAAGREH